MNTDVVIIGAGPAGLVASIECAKKGLQVVVIDEYFIAGGRLLGQLYENPNVHGIKKVWNGKEIAKNLTEQAMMLGVKILSETSVWSIKGFTVYVNSQHVREIHAKTIILATGAMEKGMPLNGWTKVGVMTVGAAQTFTNVHNVKIGNRVIFVGIDPLSISVALEMKQKGIHVVGMMLPYSSIKTVQTTPLETVHKLMQAVHLAPNKLVRFFGKLVKGKLDRTMIHAFKFPLKINGIPIYIRKAVTGIQGGDEVESVTVQPLTAEGVLVGEKEVIEVDTVCLSAGLLPLVELSQLLNCELVDIPELGGIVPLHNERLKTTIEGVYVAGNITGIEGATVAMAQGKLAAISLLYDNNIASKDELNVALQEVEQARILSPLKFLPNIVEGRKKMQQLWKEYNALR